MSPIAIQASSWLDALGRLSREAGEVILAVYSTDFQVRGKADASPVTEADERAEAVILRGLRDLAADIPVVAEEGVAAGRVPEVADRFWLVDPLDGTKEFISRNGEVRSEEPRLNSSHQKISYAV